MYILRYAPKTLSYLSSCSKADARRILTKLEHFRTSGQPLYFAKSVHNLAPATHRFRIGKYRVLFALEKEEDKTIVQILAILRRDRAYKHPLT